MSYILAIAIGFTIIVSMVQNARLEHEINIHQVTLLNFMTGITGASLYFVFSGESLSQLTNLATMPFLGYIGGAIGVIVVTLSTIVIKKVSIIASAMLMYTGQLLMGLIIDYGRGTELSIGKIIGCILIVAGVYFNSYVDSKKTSTPRIVEA